MNITEWATKNKTTVIVTTLLVLICGLYAYMALGKLENPKFTIQTAMVVTEYPGADAETVELLVTEVLEQAIQKMGSLKRVRSVSKANLSTIFVDVKGKYKSDDLPSIWDELREYIRDAEAQLPNGAQRPQVIDHYGNTFGVFLALHGEDFTPHELKEFATYLQKRLKRCEDVAEVVLCGIQDERIEIILSQERMALLGINPQLIMQTIQQQNAVLYVGNLTQGAQRIRVVPRGDFTSVDDIRNLVISGGNEDLVLLGDLAEVKRMYIDPPQALMRFNGKSAVGIGISTVDGGNAMVMGKAVQAELDKLMQHMPVGLHIDTINFQSTNVKRSINSFILALIEAIIIVMCVLFVFLGFRSSIVIINGLLFNIAATFIVMLMLNIDLQLVSISSLIIALGMLVDDSVVVTDNILVRLQGGKLTHDEASIQAAKATGWPQLVATYIAVVSFLPVFLAPSATGQYCASLFIVISVALGMSWIQAMTVVPVMGGRFLKVDNKQKDKEAFQGRLYNAYRMLLSGALRHRILTLVMMGVLLVLAGWGFKFVKQTFMPPTDRPQFRVNYWLPEGSDIRQTSRDLKEIETYILSLPGVESMATMVGSGMPRFVLTLNPEQPNPAYGFMVVNTTDRKAVPKVMVQLEAYLQKQFPDSDALVTFFNLGGQPDYSIEARFSGDDPEVLRGLAAQATAIMRAHTGTENIRTDWRNRVMLWNPGYNQGAGRRADISRQDMAQSLLWHTEGIPVDTYREGDNNIPIHVRAPVDERTANNNLQMEPLWGSGEQSVPLGAVIDQDQMQWEDPMIYRRHRIRTIAAQCNPTPDITAIELQKQLMAEIEAIELPPAYTFEWGGLYEYATESNNSIYQEFPIALILMLIGILVLFNGMRQLLIIICTLPLAIIGVVAGLLLSGKGFGFMALLGLYSLLGMMIRNAVILIGEMDELSKSETDRYQAVFDASISRLRPVLITALCTTLGMIPLIADNLFGSMAVTIMGGLLFATILTLVVIPVLYTLFYRIKCK